MNPIDDDADGVLDLMVETLRVEADGVLSVTLVDPEGYWLPEWEAGAHIDLVVGDHVRQYSLCGDLADRRRYTVAVLQEDHSRGGSDYVHTTLRPGDMVEVSGPRNHFVLQPAGEYLFIAGGIGITPLIPMIREAEGREVPWRLAYGGRTASAMAFRESLQQYGDKVHFFPESENGRLDVGAILGDATSETGVYVCGPAGLIDAVENHCCDLAVGSFHAERFVAKDLSGLVNDWITVQCRKSKRELEVSPTQTILDSLESAGINIPYACRDGVCGSCEVPVLEGTPEHRDSFRGPADLDDTSSLAVCVSRVVGDELVLDI